MTPAPRTWLHDAYELLLVLVLGWLLTVPLHQSRLEHRNLHRTLVDDRVLVRGDGLEVGQELPAYRFNWEWRVPIGVLRVQEHVGSDVLLVPAGPMHWPIGRHGRVVLEDAGTVVLDIGSELHLAPGNKLGVYRGRKWLGDVELLEVSPHQSTARVAFSPGRPLGGLEVTEYTFMTQVVVRDEPWWIVLAEVALGLGPALAWLVIRLRTGGSGLAVVGERVRSAFGAWWPWVPLALEVPMAAGLFGAFLPSAIVLALFKLTTAAGLPVLDLWPSFAPHQDLAVGLAFGSAGAWVVATRTSFLAAASGWLGWRRSAIAQVPGAWRAPVNWVLHLVIVWAFASTLSHFLVGNLSAARDLARVVPTVEGAFEIAKFGLWSLTILGCMLGYAHTVVAGLLGASSLRSLDFTWAGWITNAACYPLLGFAMARLVGGRTGLDPIVVGGFSGDLLLVLGLLTNVAYTAAIWNMGTRFGVMTDKGLVSHWFFGVVRHPCYALEGVMFLLLEAPGYTTWHQWVAGLSIVWLYWLRSEREDAFMAASCPEYPAYREAVPYKYVPGVW